MEIERMRINLSAPGNISKIRQGHSIPEISESADRAGADGRNYGCFAELFAGQNIGDMDFDGFSFDSGDSVADGVAVMRQRSGINYYARRFGSLFMKEINYFPFVIGLEEFQI